MLLLLVVRARARPPPRLAALFALPILILRLSVALTSGARRPGRLTRRLARGVRLRIAATAAALPFLLALLLLVLLNKCTQSLA